MKNANGYGSVAKQPGRRRKPWMVRVSLGRDDDGVLHRKVIGWFETRAEANICLAEFNKDRSAFLGGRATLREVYDQWHEDEFVNEKSENRELNYSRAFKKLSAFYAVPFRDIRLLDIQPIMDAQTSHDAAFRIKALMNKLACWAIPRDYASRNISEGLIIKQTCEKVEKDVLSAEEIDEIFSDNSRLGKMLQILIYTGLRRGELFNLRREDFHPEEKYFKVVVSKTASGVRMVPVHEKIYKTFMEFYDEGQEYVCATDTGAQWKQDNWQKQFKEYKRLHNITHNAHECRHTFITNATLAGCRELFIQQIVGHSNGQSVTEKVYTHIHLPQLLQEINKIP